MPGLVVGDLAAPRRGRVAVLELGGDPGEAWAVGRFVEVPAEDHLRLAHGGDPVQGEPGLVVPLGREEAEVGADDREPGTADPDHGGGEPPLVQPGGVRQQHILGALHIDAQRGHDHRSCGGRPARDVTEL